jgi:tetratricopeptide (TPR) repeat protein
MRLAIAASMTLVLLAGVVGCGPGPRRTPPPKVVTVAPAKLARPKTYDEARLKQALTGQHLSAAEVAELSDRLLADGSNTFHDQATMARLELLILKSMNHHDKTYRPVLWRNLGILHYHQKKYKQARQELQAANELNPKNARVHFYLACLFAHEGNIYAKKGKGRVARQQYKRAAIEMEQAHKLAPHNPLYKQSPKEVIQQESSR